MTDQAKHRKRTERARIVLNGCKKREEIEQIFIDCEHYNRLHPDQVVDADPDGTMRKLADRLDVFLDQVMPLTELPPFLDGPMSKTVQ
jgi:hypothetical protein